MALHLHRDATDHANGFFTTRRVVDLDVAIIDAWHAHTLGVTNVFILESYSGSGTSFLCKCVSRPTPPPSGEADCFPASCRFPLQSTDTPTFYSRVFDNQYLHNILFCRADWVNEPIPELKDGGRQRRHRSVSFSRY